MKRKRHYTLNIELRLASTHAANFFFFFRSFERELIKLLDYEMMTIFLKHPINSIKHTYIDKKKIILFENKDSTIISFHSTLLILIIINFYNIVCNQKKKKKRKKTQIKCGLKIYLRDIRVFFPFGLQNPKIFAADFKFK